MRQIILAVLLAVVVVGNSYAAPDAHAEPPVPALPTGPLQLFAGNKVAANFIVLDETKRTGTLVDTWIFQVPLEPYSFAKVRTPQNTIVQTMDHLTFDCRKRDVFVRLSDSSFNAEGRRVVWLPRDDPEPIAAGSMTDYLAQVVCDHHPLPPSNTVTGYEAAMMAAHLALNTGP